MAIFLGYEFSPNMMGIQEGYNRNFHIRASNNMRSWIPCTVLRYKDGDIRVMLVSNCGLVRILVLRFVFPKACMYGLLLCDEIGA